MRARTLAALSIIIIAAGGVGVVALTDTAGAGTTMTVTWVSDTARDTGGNHHAPAAANAAGVGDVDPMVYAPISGRADTNDCALVALGAGDGAERWSYPVPAANCTIHAVADPTLADFDSDGVRELLAATTEQAVTAYHPRTGDVEFRHNLTSYGYTSPVVGDLVGDDRPEVVVVDVRGTVFVLRANGTVVWSRQLSSYTWGQPAIEDFDGDGAPELAVGLGDEGKLRLFEADGSPAWDEPQSYGSSITWMTTGQADEDGAVEVVVATANGGRVSMVDGATGERVWTREFGAFAAVHAFGDGDGDGDPEVYAVAKDGDLRSVDGATGRTEWTTTLTTASVQMMPPPALGDVDGDGDAELLAVTNDGIVSAVDPVSGEVLATHERDGEARIYTHPELADTDDDGREEAFVMYADGRVFAFEFG
jgi:outer membrane protein assembly factor BamB